MKWLTLTEIGRRARSKKGALEVSYEHWNQLYMAKAKELREAIRKEKVGVGNEYCGLCQFYKPDIDKSNCGACPLGASDGSCYKHSGTLFAKALSEFHGLEYRKGDWRAWKRAVKALRNKLKELMVIE